MAFDDRISDGRLAVRSLSEQLRDLEARLGHDNELSLPQVGRRTALPTHLGRPIGLTRLEDFPRIARLDADEPAPKPPLSRAAAMRRGATIVGAGLLLLATTAIVPPLFFRYPTPAATQEPASDQVLAPLRTERFAQSAQQLRLAGPATVSYLKQASTVVPSDSVPFLRPTITLAVAKNETARVDLPTMISGLGAGSAGSAVVIDGLPVGTRVSHGLPIARDSWTVSSADVQSAVVFLPRNTPERVDLRVRVIAADSQELAANALEIRVLRATDVTAVGAPAGDGITARPSTSRYEPTAAEGKAMPDPMVLQPPRLR